MSDAALSANNQNQAMQALSQQSFQSASNNELASQLFKQYGVHNVLKSVTNAAADYLQMELNELIESMGMPEFLADDAKNQVSLVGSNFKSETPGGAQEGVNEVLQNPAQKSGGASQKSGSQVTSGVMDMVKKSMQDETEQASKNNSGSGGNGNWLAILAKALGKTAGEALKNMVDLGKKMGAIDSKENPEAFAETQAEFQAQAQIFKMFQEAIGTMIKSIGEGMSSVARKQ